MIGVIVAPCKDCPQKGCGAYHSECKKYAAYKTELKAYRDKLKEESLRLMVPVTPIAKQSKNIKERSRRRRKT